MKTTKPYKLLLLLLLFISRTIFASDSLKVKKIEYFEEGKLVRAEYIDTLSLKTKEVFIHYKEGFEGREQNEVCLIQSENGKYILFKTYHVNIIGDSIFFYNPNNLGSIQKVTYYSDGKKKESLYEQLYLKSDTLDRTFLLNDINFNLEELKFPLKIKYLYDKSGNVIEDRWINNNSVTYRIRFTYDNIGRVLTSKRTSRGEKEWTTTDINYEGTIITYLWKVFKRKKLNDYVIRKVIFNENKQEILIEKYKVSLQNSKSIDEPKLSFTQENIYENNRIVRIVYSDHILNKTKIHELKYEFYN